jgi:hypothetical protein
VPDGYAGCCGVAPVSHEDTPAEQAPLTVWWRSWMDRQVHGFDLSGVDPSRVPEVFTALCGHQVPVHVIEPQSSGMPCVACLVELPRPDKLPAAG